VGLVSGVKKKPVIHKDESAVLDCVHAYRGVLEEVGQSL
jgi:hypothetical protein